MMRGGGDVIETAIIGHGGGKRGGGLLTRVWYRRFLPSGACICAWQMGQVGGC